ncbi:hypothetical protein ACF06X_27310 [Streptomyces sp. NPDC015346]|uniref:hypothetical protein n=1 Tax=Streptomyces sp. NPDC015346 TaxID=3364954 RepID=UPI0036F50677
MRIRLVQGLALLSTGALAGAFGYGAANLVPAFNAVPLDYARTSAAFATFALLILLSLRTEAGRTQ